MILMKPSATIEFMLDGDEILARLERAGRTCYSPDTEILTDGGWVRLDALPSGALVLTYDASAASLQYEDPDLVVQDFDGEMLVCKHRALDFCVTPDHRMWATGRKDKARSGYHFVPASTLLTGKSLRVPKWFQGTMLYQEKAPPVSIEMPDAPRGGAIPDLVTKGRTLPLNDAFLVLMGAYITEGHLRQAKGTGAGVCLTQSEDTPLYPRILTALQALDLPFNIHPDPRKPEVHQIAVGGGLPVRNWFRDNCGEGSFNKKLPGWFRWLHPQDKRLLLEVLYQGDGSHNTTRTEKYLSVSPLLLNQVQELHILLGRNASLGWTDHSSWVNPCGYVEECQRDSWVVRPEHIAKVEYRGKVYCPSTKAGIVCVRRDGKAFWCGNCYKSEEAHDKQVAKLLDDPKFLPDYPSCPPEFTGNFSAGYLPVRGMREEAAHKQVTQAFIKMLLKRGHESTIEHVGATVRFIVDRGCSHELVRHRLAAYSQESTRYVDYTGDKSDGHCQFIIPPWATLDPGVYEYDEKKNGGWWTCNGQDLRDSVPGDRWWLRAMWEAETNYRLLRRQYGWSPQQARTVLPNSTKTEVVMTANLREFRWVFRKRADGDAHPQMREVMVPLLGEFRARVPVLFDDAFLPEEKIPDAADVLRHLWEDITTPLRLRDFVNPLALVEHLVQEHGPAIKRILGME